MKIGILGCFYDCAEDIDDVLEPWKRVKEESYSHELLISSIHCQFKEYADMGIPNYDGHTAAKIAENKTIDLPFTSMVPLTEAQARSLPLNFLLEQDVDAVWLLDGDEFYTIKEINSIIKYVEDNPDYYYYKINFKNYIFDGKKWIDGFCPNRIFWTNKAHKIDKFYWDNDILYSNGSTQSSFPECEIPRDVAHIRHMTWLHSNGKKKTEYHAKHFGECSYKWNEEKSEIELDLDYYKKHSKETPKINED